MKTIKTKFGEVGFIETNDTYEDSIKKIPEGWRAIEDYEILYLWRKEENKIKNLLDNREEEVWIKENLFWPVGRNYFSSFVGYWASRGVIVIKKGQGLK